MSDHPDGSEAEVDGRDRRPVGPLHASHGAPSHVRSDNGPEFIAKAVRDWIAAVGARTAYIEPGSPWENGYCESFNSKLRDELLEGGDGYTALGRGRTQIGLTDGKLMANEVMVYVRKLGTIDAKVEGRAVLK